MLRTGVAGEILGGPGGVLFEDEVIVIII